MDKEISDILTKINSHLPLYKEIRENHKRARDDYDAAWIHYDQTEVTLFDKFSGDNFQSWKSAKEALGVLESRVREARLADSNLNSDLNEWREKALELFQSKFLAECDAVIG